MEQLLLLGDEAIGLGAMDAGISGVYAYPGTPSTEITEYIQEKVRTEGLKIHADWSSNEKTAMEEALGMAYSGKRSLVCMKHVGLNVAADPFMNAAITGINGGMVIVVADDPSMHSSQNEQDSRFYAKYALIPALEPSSQQEAYDMVFYAFELSEKYKVPVMVRITTRLAHSRSGIIRRAPVSPNKLKLPSDVRQFILLPAMARVKYQRLLDNQESFEMESETSGWNEISDGPDRSWGIVTSGIAYNYYMENALTNKLEYPVVRITQYPVPKMILETLVNSCGKILVLEEGYPMIEEMLRGLFNTPYKILGRLDGSLPRAGELNPGLVGKALGFSEKILHKIPEVVVSRPPSLCKGCSHADVYLMLNKALEEFEKGHVFSDIGCYTLGALPPYETINSCVDMGASITMAKGAADAGLRPSVAVIGDSTFTHSGMTGLLDAVIERSPVTIVISDNSTTGMTGGQSSAATGRLEKICLGIGVEPEHLIAMTPLRKNHNDNVEAILRELNYDGVSVIIAQRECIQTSSKRK